MFAEFDAPPPPIKEVDIVIDGRSFTGITDDPPVADGGHYQFTKSFSCSTDKSIIPDLILIKRDGEYFYKDTNVKVTLENLEKAAPLLFTFQLLGCRSNVNLPRPSPCGEGYYSAAKPCTREPICLPNGYYPERPAPDYCDKIKAQEQTGSVLPYLLILGAIFFMTRR